MKFACSIESTPAFKALLFPRDHVCAQPSCHGLSFINYCLHFLKCKLFALKSVFFDMTPPVAKILIKSAPNFLLVQTFSCFPHGESTYLDWERFS
ncbi:MAG: hypothetical protein CM15mP22_5980 [Gammaproteobacteria bacterium]|nr:MAG: hypothetical protein CM15mP22_5980 [Gammaproteobacteria bacterium]